MCRLLRTTPNASNCFFSPSESDDSDDEIIVKTTSWPVHQAASIDSNGLDCTDKESDLRDSSKNTSDDDDFRGKGESGNKKNFEVNGESGGTNDIADEVIEKVQRGRMEFPCSSECSSAPTKSCLNNHNSSSCEHSHHKPKTSNKKTNHQGN